jgi:hypothetical protein
MWLRMVQKFSLTVMAGRVELPRLASPEPTRVTAGRNECADDAVAERRARVIANRSGSPLLFRAVKALFSLVDIRGY